MKIRFYHWWVYKLWYYTWTPILQSRPELLKFIVSQMNDYLKDKAQK